jgi:hypothetical protein
MGTNKRQEIYEYTLQALKEKRKGDIVKKAAQLAERLHINKIYLDKEKKRPEDLQKIHDKQLLAIQEKINTMEASRTKIKTIINDCMVAVGQKPRYDIEGYSPPDFDIKEKKKKPQLKARPKTTNKPVLASSKAEAIIMGTKDIVEEKPVEPETEKEPEPTPVEDSTAEQIAELSPEALDQLIKGLKDKKVEKDTIEAILSKYEDKGE